MIVRKAKISDAIAIRNIIKIITREGRAIIDIIPTLKEQKDFMHLLSLREAIFVIDDNEKIGGFQSLCLLVKNVKQMRHVAELDTYLLPDYREKGFGKKLFKVTSKFAKSKNYAKIIAFVSAGNTESLKFHESLGFKVGGKFSKQIKHKNKYGDELFLEYFL